MARFYGDIGFSIVEETRPGVFEEKYIEKKYTGEVLKSNRRWNPSEYLNVIHDLDIFNDISIIADNFINSHFGVMRYVRWMNQCFEITSAVIDTERHRITLSLGGVFHVPDNSGT